MDSQTSKTYTFMGAQWTVGKLLPRNPEGLGARQTIIAPSSAPQTIIAPSERSPWGSTDDYCFRPTLLISIIASPSPYFLYPGTVSRLLPCQHFNANSAFFATFSGCFHANICFFATFSSIKLFFLPIHLFSLPFIAISVFFLQHFHANSFLFVFRCYTSTTVEELAFPTTKHQTSCQVELKWKFFWNTKCPFLAQDRVVLGLYQSQRIVGGYRRSNLRQDPLEAILVIFGRKAIISFGWKLLEKYENWHQFCPHAQWWSPWRRKMSEKGTSFRRI